MKKRVEELEKIILSADRQKKINNGINCLLEQFHWKERLIDLLLLIKLKYPHFLGIALQRVERERYEPGSKDAKFLKDFKDGLKKYQ